MRILKPFFAVALTALFITSCGTTKNTTSATSTSVNNDVKEITIITADSVIPKLGEMTKAEIQAWPHMDIFADSIPGISLNKAYDFVKNKKGETVIVGVIDSGIDIEHEDLDDVVWVNEDEIAGNKKDDDNNGYIDDIHGWNFLGGEKGTTNPEQLEMTRMVKKWMPKFDGKSAEDITEADKADFELFTKLKKIIDEKNKNAEAQVNQYKAIKEMVIKANDTVTKILAGKEMNVDNLNAIKFDDQMLQQGKFTMMRILSSGDSVDGAFKQLDGIIDHYSNQLNSQYKIDFNGRVAGDDPYDINDVGYGNPYVIGSKDGEMHGTHVAGIIAAERNNGIGMNGVAHNVKIMAIRAVPDGDEYDKDVALAIRYAVDNGAKVINMSFGKSYSPNAEWVYDAIKYAEEKDVLLVHAAGNDGSDIDSAENFPNDSKDKITEFADNVITVGAMTRHFDDKLVASFSNYGKKNVDIFAPGLEIYSTVPKNEYESIQGTSMAAPEVAGVAALIRSYYPDLTAGQVKKIIMDSGIEFKKQVIRPGSDSSKAMFVDLSISGKILNAYNALVMAEKMSVK
ncbi:S8 family peptidase [Aureibaculum sp. 2210JD6-5]|uniref:S8 family peptidase n=1 Tax=Aureibaculum sp. 2210JD6-5 TaxID=3103957 RepID=UPI002AAD175A|nr:S8 family peptidase [Aureibaculum sp. 2210JD6-5]MDY7396426.1 S8 family peptidase [Aureibaculum sp. 2210JD6-5]